jgi:hypothetical protein
VAEEKEIRWGVEEIKEKIESAVLVFFALVPAQKMGVGVGENKRISAVRCIPTDR